MKKLLLILLCVPLMFSCGENQKELEIQEMRKEIKDLKFKLNDCEYNLEKERIESQIDGKDIRKEDFISGCISGDCENGYGIFVWPDGDKYQGNHKGGKSNDKEGLKIYFDDGKYIGEYVGGFKDDKRHGLGTMIYANGDKHVGEHRNGLPNGIGTFTASNGDIYIGGWKNGGRHGEATFILRGELEMLTLWDNNKLIKIYQDKGELLK